MPKKQPRNAYYFYMTDFREDQRKKGIIYQDLQEVQKAADPHWREAPPPVRAKYEALAKKEKERLRGAPDRKFTSNGFSFEEIETQQRLAQENEELELTEVHNFVKQKIINNLLLEEDIFLIDVNTFCLTGSYYYMAESTVLRFSLLEGIKDTYHEVINPGRIPIGYASDVKLASQEIGLPMPDEDKPTTEYPKVLAYLMDYLKQKSKDGVIPPLYTLPEKVEQAQDFIKQLCTSSGEYDSQLRVYKLENLFFHTVNAIRSSPEEGYPRISLASAQIKKDIFKYTPHLGCEAHEFNDKAMECTKSRVQRWAYTVLDKCCPAAGIEPRPGKHIPLGVDYQGVLTFKEMKKEMRRDRQGQASASSAASSCSASVVNDDASSTSAWDKSKAPRRPHEPLRMPKTDYSQAIREAPELTEDNFPTLSVSNRFNRGRGLSRGMNKLSLDK